MVTPTLRPQGHIARRHLLDRLGAPAMAPFGRHRSDGNVISLGGASCAFLSAHPTAQVRGFAANLLLGCNEAQDVAPSRWDAVFDPMGASNNATQVFSGTVWTSRTLLARWVTDPEKYADSALHDEFRAQPDDDALLEELTRRAYDDVVASGLGGDVEAVENRHARGEQDLAQPVLGARGGVGSDHVQPSSDRLYFPRSSRSVRLTKSSRESASSAIELIRTIAGPRRPRSGGAAWRPAGPPRPGRRPGSTRGPGPRRCALGAGG